MELFAPQNGNFVSHCRRTAEKQGVPLEVRVPTYIDGPDDRVERVTLRHNGEIIATGMRSCHEAIIGSGR